MDTNALKSAAATWLRLLIVAVVLFGLLLASGIACGGGDDDRDSRPTSRSSDRDSSSDSEDLDEDADEDEDEDRESSLRRTSDGVSVQELSFVPNLEFTELVMIDAATYFSGDLPAEIEAKVAELYEEYWNRYGKPLVVVEDEGSVIPTADADAVIVMIHDDYDVAVAVLGSYEPTNVRSAFNASEQHQPYGRDELGYILWRDTENCCENVILVMDQFYIDWGVEGFLQTFSQQDTLLDNPDSPMVRAKERAGSGWLMLGMEGSYCYDLRVEFDEDSCLAMAYSSSSSGRSRVDAAWVILLDTEENAQLLLQLIEDKLESEDSLPEVFETPWISEINTDGEFIVATGSFTPEEAVEFMEEF